MTVVVTLLGAFGISPAVAAAAKTVSVKLSSVTIVADGKSTSVATATVKNDQGAAVAGDIVKFSSSSGQGISATTNHKDGTYTATVTATTTAGTSTITATDTTPKRDVSGTATLVQAPGPAAHVVVRLSPQSILANGISTSASTATVTDAFNNRVAGEKIGLSANDAGIRFGPATDNRDGTYSSILTSSRTPGIKTISATDSATGVAGTAPLTLATAASTVSVSAVPAAPLTNQPVMLVAIVMAPGSGSAPPGTVTFSSHGRPIVGCARQPAVVQAGQQLSESTCQSPFAALSSPDDVEASFRSASPNIADASATTTLSIGRAGTSTSLDVSNTSVSVGARATFTAQVAPTQTGPTLPSGSVDFFDGGQPIAACSNVPLLGEGASLTATCTVQYSQSRQHSITARYDGDANFTGSNTASAQRVKVHALPPHVLGTIRAVMHWTFYYTPRYTKILALNVRPAPVGASVAVTCRGRGCPFVKRINSVRAGTVCKPSRGRKCPAQQSGAIDLQRAFQRSRLTVGAQVIVRITRANWIGKYYLFRIRAGHPPVIRITCLAPGASRPGVGC